jgi:hypothetical protein
MTKPPSNVGGGGIEIFLNFIYLFIYLNFFLETLQSPRPYNTISIKMGKLQVPNFTKWLK